jgi:hypothetical protein
VFAEVGVAHPVGVGFEVGQRFRGVAVQGQSGGFGDEGFDVAGVEVGQPGVQPVVVAPGWVRSSSFARASRAASASSAESPW